jgi:hypothetical protein
MPAPGRRKGGLPTWIDSAAVPIAEISVSMAVLPSCDARGEFLTFFTATKINPGQSKLPGLLQVLPQL